MDEVRLYLSEMGALVLDTISKDNDERIASFYRLKAEHDRESQMLYAEYKGREQGKLESAINIVKELNVTVTKALKVANLPESERETLIDALNQAQIPYED